MHYLVSISISLSRFRVTFAYGPRSVAEWEAEVCQGVLECWLPLRGIPRQPALRPIVVRVVKIPGAAHEIKVGVPDSNLSYVFSLSR